MKSHFLPKVSLLAVAVAMALPVYAVDGIDSSGSNARNQALLSNYFSLKDDFNIFANPALINEHAGRAYINHTEMGGANVGVGPGTLGVYLGRTYSGYIGSGFMQEGSYTGGTAVSAPTNRFDVLYGMKLGGMNAGARLNWNSISSKSTNSTTNVTDELSVRDINLSAGIALTDIPLDVAVTYGLITLSDTRSAAGTVTNSLVDNSASSLGLVGRIEAIKGRNSSLLVSGGYLLDKPNSKLTNDSSATFTTIDRSFSSLGLGATFSYAASSNQEFAVTAGIMSVTNETDTAVTGAANVHSETNTKTLPVTARYELTGLGESQKWALRGALSKNFYRAVNTKTATTTSESYDTQGLNWGIGVGYAATKNLTIDASMDQGYLFDGTALFSGGTATGGPLISRLTVNYSL